MFTYCMVFKQQIYCLFLWMGVHGSVGGGVVCGSHNCIILTIKTCFDKKATFLALVPVLVKQPSLLLNICMFKMKTNLKNICNLQKWYQNMHNCKSLFKQILPVGKNYKSVKKDHILLVVVLQRCFMVPRVVVWLSYTGWTEFLVNSTHYIFTLSENAFKTINLCFTTYFFLGIFFLHK